MPLLTLTTNREIPAAERHAHLQDLSRQAAEWLGKPEAYVMVDYRHHPDMLFGGSAEPLAYIEFKSIGLPAGRTAELSAALAAWLEAHVGIAAARVYVEFSDAERHLWGWNGATFAR